MNPYIIPIIPVVSIFFSIIPMALGGGLGGSTFRAPSQGVHDRLIAESQ